MKKRFVLIVCFLLVCVQVMYATCPTPDGSNRFGNQEDVASDVCSYTGDYSVRGFRTLTINGDFTVDGNFTVNGTLVVNGTLTVLNGGNLDVVGAIIVNGTVDVSGSMDIDLVGSMTVNSTGNLNVEGDVNNGGWWDFPDTNAGSITVGGDFINEENGNLTIGDGAVLDVQGEIVSETGSTFDVEDGGTISAGDGFVDNGGTVNVVGADADCSDGCCGAICAAMPVELTYLDIEERLGQTYLVWETAAELDNEGFEVEWKATDIEEFKTIGFVFGHGTTSQVNNYQYAVSDLGEGYFRLKQVDYDGDFEYSPIISYEGANFGSGFEVYPNPTPGRIHLSGSGLHSFTLYDQNGTTLIMSATSELSEAERVISDYLTDQSAGMYLLALQTESGMENLRIIKRNSRF